MRLKCPNCDAQYEVGDGVIPPQGRDVQCSNCGNTWYQYPEGHDDRPEEEALITPPNPDVGVDVQPEQAPAAEPEPEPTPDQVSQPDEPMPEDDFEAALQAALDTDEGQGALIEGDPVEDAVAEMMDAVPPAATQPLPKRDLAPEITDVLREEADREIEHRRQEHGEDLQTQPDLGLDDGQEATDSRAAAARARMARRRGGTESAAPARREMLPDIEEINSSLRSTSERTRDVDAPVSDDVEEVRSKRSGFRTGFILILFLAVLAFVVYAFAPQIIEQVPQAKPYLEQYVQLVNKLRVTLDELIQRLIAYVQSLTA